MSRPRRLHTLSGRLIALFVVTAVVFVVFVGATISGAFHHHFESDIRPHLLRYLEYIRDDIGVPPDRVRAAQIARELPVEIHILGEGGQWSSSGASFALADVRIHRHFHHAGMDYAIGEIGGREYLISYLPDYTLAFSVPRDRANWRTGILPLLVLLLILAALYHATRRLFAPIETIKFGIERIGSGDLTHRLNIKRRDELGVLALSINAMADDIQQMLEAKRQLLLAISHELRSPLTRMKICAEMTTDSRQRAELHRDLNEMESLIEELLESERLNARHQVLTRTPTSMNRLIHDIVEEFFNTGNIVLDLPNEEIIADVDVARMRILFKNLFDNALRHTPDNAPPPCLSMFRHGNEIDIEVRDFGPGVAPHHLPHLTEPFYRVDPARRRDTGGYGLGLYLCRKIIEAHSGEIKISSELGRGTTVNVRIPSIVD